MSTVFALHGGHLDSFFQGCRQCGIRLVDTRHEAAAVNAADAYARMTGGLGVVAVTSGPGFTNAYAGLANAYADGVPILLITSSPPLGEVETNELQGGIDQVAAANAVTKWAHRITTVERIADLTGLAARLALAAGRSARLNVALSPPPSCIRSPPCCWATPRWPTKSSCRPTKTCPRPARSPASAARH